MYTYNKNSHKSSGFCECENRSLLRMDPSAVERGNLTRVQPARGGQSSEMAATPAGPCFGRHIVGKGQEQKHLFCCLRSLLGRPFGLGLAFSEAVTGTCVSANSREYPSQESRRVRRGYTVTQASQSSSWKPNSADGAPRTILSRQSS